jgi:hypothetical protein
MKTMPKELQIIRVPYVVPYTAQVATPELAGAIFVDGMDAALDPRWAETGASDPAEYAYWTDRACGIACVKMCIEALGGPVRPMMDWIRAGLECGGYLIEHDGNGGKVERGWVHSALVKLIRSEGFLAEPRPMNLGDFPNSLSSGKLIIASVSYEVGTPQPVTKKGGHLVVVTGVDLEDNRLARVIIHNPSGRTAEMRVNAPIPAERFQSGFTGRVIVVGPDRC